MGYPKGRRELCKISQKKPKCHAVTTTFQLSSHFLNFFLKTFFLSKIQGLYGYVDLAPSEDVLIAIGQSDKFMNDENLKSDDHSY
jgi:hypothetical protein